MMNQSAFRAEIVRRAENMVIPPKTFDFGKHRGRTVEIVLSYDPDYFIWCWSNVPHWKLPFGKAEVDRAWDLSREYGVSEDDYDHMDDPVEQWAREIAWE